jgi:hypothetical protein|tara:strand:- start:862 stop:1452 length:591 start_codon:yes stop_codon:yes gene_type:complete
MAKPTIVIAGKKYPMTQLIKALRKIGKIWRKNARISLRKQDKVNTGALYNSMSVTVGEDKEGYFVNITPQVHYWEFVDKGVQGASRNIFTRQSESPFKFGSGKGPRGLRGAIDKWVIKKGIEGTRDAQGRFVTRKSLVFMISSAIYNRGLKPTFFISDTRKRLKSKALLWLAQALGEDVASALRLNLKLNKNLDVK